MNELEETAARERAATQVVDAALRVHRDLGPGLVERVYELCLLLELRAKGLEVERQVAVPVEYRGVRIEEGFRMDLLVERQLIVELKAVDVLSSLHRAQLLTYLKITGHRLGLLINFNVPLLKSGIRRVIR